MRRHLLIFDIDGTLVDSERMILAAQGAAFAALGLPAPTRERGLSIVGLSLKEAFRELAGADGPVEALAEAYRGAFFRLRSDGTIPEPLYEGADALIETYSARTDIALGIATGKSRRGVGAILERHGWQNHFATIQTADDAPSKPHPGMILQASAEARITPENAVMIGDSSFDMAMAGRAGARAIGVAWGFQSREALLGAGAEVIAGDFVELDGLIRAIVG